MPRSNAAGNLLVQDPQHLQPTCIEARHCLHRCIQDVGLRWGYRLRRRCSPSCSTRRRRDPIARVFHCHMLKVPVKAHTPPGHCTEAISISLCPLGKWPTMQFGRPQVTEEKPRCTLGARNLAPTPHTNHRASISAVAPEGLLQ